MEKVLEASHVTIGYKIEDFRDIGLKEWAMRHLTHNYHAETFQAVRDVSFDLYTGEMLDIIGGNGTRNSTLLNAVSGIMEPTSGTIARHGSVSALLELASGFDGDLTVKENAYLRGGHAGVHPDLHGPDERANHLLCRVGAVRRPTLQAALHRDVIPADLCHRLPGSARTLILDEVLSVGDGAF